VSCKHRKVDLIAAQIALTNKRDEICLKCCVAAISVAVQDQYRENIAVFITLIVEKLQSLKDRRAFQRLKYDVTIRPLDCKGAFYNAYIENTDQRRKKRKETNGISRHINDRNKQFSFNNI